MGFGLSRMRATGAGLLVAAMALTACGGASTPAAGAATQATKTSQPASSGSSANAAVIKIGLDTFPPTMDPAKQGGIAQRLIKAAIYQGLEMYGPSGNVVPGLADSHTQPKPTEFVFHLRPNAEFSNGTPVTPADVVYTFQRIMNVKNGEYLYARFNSLINSVTATGNHDVTLTLKSPVPAVLLMEMLAMPEAGIVSKAFTEAHHGNLGDVALGAGPYELTDFQHGTSLVLKANPHYYEAGYPKTQEIQARAYTDGNLRVQALLTGAVNLIDFVPWANVTQLKAAANVTFAGTNTGFQYLLMNLTKPPFNNVLVRQAMAYAVNRTAMVKSVFYGLGSTIHWLPFRKGNLAYDPTLANSFVYDPAKAKQLLKEAGYPSGFSTTMLASSNIAAHKGEAEIVQQDLQAIGVNVKMDLTDFAEVQALQQQGNYELSIEGGGFDYQDPSAIAEFYQTGSATTNRSVGFSDPTLDKLLVEGETTTSTAQRAKIYQQIDALAIKDVPMVWLNWRVEGTAYSKNLRGFVAMPGNADFYSGYTLQDATLGPSQ